MGSLLGKTLSIEEGLSPAYRVLATRPGYELRAYPSYVVAEVQGSTKPGDEDSCFFTLAKYIGVIGAPMNRVSGKESGESIAMTAPVVTGQSEKIAMTAPVVTGRAPASGEKISMTAPVVTGATPTEDATKISMTAPVVQASSEAAGAQTMQFIMPTKYKSISDLPAPTDERVTLREVPEVSYLVHKFSGNMGSDVEATSERQRAITEQAVEKDGGAFSEYVKADAKYLLARYNPPWTVPFLRTNELWFPLPLSEEEIKSNIPSA